jgi:hypothetical protein
MPLHPTRTQYKHPQITTQNANIPLQPHGRHHVDHSSQEDNRRDSRVQSRRRPADLRARVPRGGGRRRRADVVGNRPVRAPTQRRFRAARRPARDQGRARKASRVGGVGPRLECLGRKGVSCMAPPGRRCFDIALKQPAKSGPAMSMNWYWRLSDRGKRNGP